MKCNDVLLYEFLSGSLNPEKAEETAAHLEECRICRERFRIMVTLDNPEVPAAIISRSRRVFPAGKTLLLATAGLILAAGISVFYSYMPIQDNPPAGIELATIHPYPLVMLETRSSAGANLTEGLLLYREGSYREALAELEKHEENHDALFFSAISLYMLDEPVKAAEKLKRVAAVSEKWAAAAEWYRSQSLLKLGKTDEALSVLKIIAETKNQYRKEALELLKKIEKK